MHLCFKKQVFVYTDFVRWLYTYVLCTLPIYISNLYAACIYMYFIRCVRCLYTYVLCTLSIYIRTLYVVCIHKYFVYCLRIYIYCTLPIYILCTLPVYIRTLYAVCIHTYLVRCLHNYVKQGRTVVTNKMKEVQAHICNHDVKLSTAIWSELMI